MSLSWPTTVKEADGTFTTVTLDGEHDGSGGFDTITLVGGGADHVLRLPEAPTLTGSLTSRTAATVEWDPADNTGRLRVTGWEVQRRADTGAGFGAWATISGPLPSVDRSYDDTGLATGTPEIIYEYRARGTNGDGNGDWSNTVTLQWNATPDQQPPAPAQFALVGRTTTSRSFSWAAVTATPAVTKYGLYEDGVLVVDDITDTAVTWTGLIPGSTHTVTVRAYNGVWSPDSAPRTFTQPTDEPTVTTMLMGCSDSEHTHGGTEVWDGWRVYTRSAMLGRANRTGSQRPQFLAYSPGGAPLGSSSNNPVVNGNYSQIYSYVLSELNNFYYSGGASSQTQSSRWGIKLYWSNGNENSDKGMLSSNTSGNLADWMDSQRAVYDAVHYFDPQTDARRFPDAYAGSNPTQEHERTGIVAWWLHPSAQYHDFVMWSMYPPGRGVNDPVLAVDPRWDYPSLNELDRQDRQQGFLLRCFYRTFQAQAQARADTGDSTFTLSIGCGETGIPPDPDDPTTRPYYAVHALAGGMQKLATIYGLPMPFACWWDNQVNLPDNRFENEIATNPSTRQAWQAWQAYNHQFGGTHPATWAGNPKASWNTTGPVV